MPKQRHDPNALFLLAAIGLTAAFAFSCAGKPQVAGSTSPAQPEKGAAAKVPRTAQEKKIAEIQGVDKLLQNGNADAAVAKLDELSSSQPKTSELKLLKAAALASAGKLDEARSETNSVLAAEPNNVKAITMAANLAHFAGDEKTRKSLLDRGIVAGPTDPDVLTAWGQYLLDQKDWKTAEGYFRRAQVLDARNFDAALGLGQSLYRQARYPEAETALDNAVALDPASPFGYQDRSKVRYQLGKYDGAIKDMDDAIAKAPDSSWLYLERGRMRLNAGQKPEAIDDFTKSIQYEPDYFLPYVYRAGIYEETGNDEGARDDYTKILAIEPDYWYAHESLGAVNFRLAKWNDSAAHFKEAYNKAPDQYEYAILSGLALLRAGKNAEAKAWAGQVAPTIDRDKNGLSWLMLRLIQDQNDQSAELEIQIQSEKSLDDKAASLFYLGEYWLARGRDELAMKYFILCRDMQRVQCLEYRLLVPELKRLGTTEAHG
jgi:tetratricopeptide (TPR) repeat protein